MAAAVPRPPSHPLRVMSLSQCTDQLVLMLLPPERIASVTWLALDPHGSLMAAAARRVAINHGLAEEIVAQHPDLVLAGTFSTPAARTLLHRLGWPMIEVGSAETFAEVRALTRRIAAAVDERARGEALIAHMDAQLADLARDRGPPLRVAAWDGAGFSARPGSLYDAVLTAAGADNVTSRLPAATTGAPDAELLLAAAPDLLVRGGGDDDRSLRANVARHPLVRRFWGRDRTLVIRPAYYLCGTPLVGDAALELRNELRVAAAAVRTPLPFAPAAR